jgi:hypothetical protein
MNYLALYYNWMRSGRLPNNGLCNSLPKTGELEMLLPLDSNRTYWGYEMCADNPATEIHDSLTDKIHYDFTPLRQNIVLFLAAINGEL